MKELDWSNIGFGYRKTDYNVRCYYRNGAWGEIEVCSDEYINMHMAATCLHYGQEALRASRHFVARTARFAYSAWRLMPSVCRTLAMAFLCRR